MNDSPTLTIDDAYSGIRSFFSQPGAVIAKNRNGRCMYRTPEGGKCAVGCLIPDELYESRFDHSPDREHIGMDLHEIVSEVWPGSVGDEQLVSFLEQAQNRHDNSPSAGSFLPLLDSLAHEFGLEVPS